MRASLILLLVATLLIPAPATARQAPAQQPPPAPLPGTPLPRGQKPVIDPDVLMHLGVTAGRLRGGKAVDITEKVTGVIAGNPMKNTIGPSHGFRFNGTTDSVVFNTSPADRGNGLPTRAFTVSTWVSVENVQGRSMIVSCLGDERGSGGGWGLGVQDGSFVFLLGAGGKPATELRAGRPVQPNRWYNVVATYDGRVSRLFVNGEPVGESTEQAGEMVYPENAVYALAAARPESGQGMLTGTILEVRVLRRAIPQQQVVEEFTPGAALASYEPTFEPTQRFVVRPFLQMATLDGITIVFEASRPCVAVVEYGDRLPYTQRVESSTPSDGLIHKVRISGLKPHAQYFYRVRLITPDQPEVLSEDLTFQTAVPPGMPVAFAVIGDTQRNKPVIDKLQKFSYTLRPNLQIHLGDVVDTGPDKKEWTEELLDASYPLMSRVPMYPAIGNHEENHSLYYRYFALPDPQFYYTFTYGDAQFFSIDTNKPVTAGSPQHQWLDRELGRSTAKWKFVYHHHPVYSSDENDYGDLYKGPSTLGDTKLADLAPLFEKHRVDIDFNGHIHSFERSWPIREGKIDLKNGVRYVTSGGGGGGLETAGPARTWFAQRVYRGHHVCHVTLFGNTLQMQVFDLEGRLIDQMDIVKE